MDIFLKNKVLIITVIVFAVFNILTLAVIWGMKFRGAPYPLPPPPRPPQEREIQPPDALEFISKELKLDVEQRIKYHEMRKQHFDGMKDLLEDIHSRKKAILELMSADNPDTAGARILADEIGRIQGSIEIKIFGHFAEFKTILSEEQKDKFRKLLKDISEGKTDMLPPPPPDTK